MPGEVSPELAHQIGEELCEKHLQGKYEYVLMTHVDKGYIHNHIIFSNVSFIDGKAYASNKKSYHQIRNMSDEICKSNGLSIATDVAQSQNSYRTNGTSYKEYQERKRGNSYKAKLQYAIDAAIRSAKDWEDFLRLLQRSGYEIKQGKYISFRAIGQERFTRSKVIGEDYTEERIKERIFNKSERVISSNIRKKRSPNKIIDISSQNSTIHSEGFAHWLKLQNLKTIAKSWTEITNNSQNDVTSFYKHVDQVHDNLGQLQNRLKKVEMEVQEIVDFIKNINTFKKYKSIYAEYQNATDRDAYFRNHESEIILFEAADTLLANSKSSLKSLDVSKLKGNLEVLNKKSEHLCQELSTQQKVVSKLNQLRSNLDMYLKIEASKDSDQSHQYQ